MFGRKLNVNWCNVNRFPISPEWLRFRRTRLEFCSKTRKHMAHYYSVTIFLLSNFSWQSCTSSKYIIYF